MPNEDSYGLEGLPPFTRLIPPLNCSPDLGSVLGRVGRPEDFLIMHPCVRYKFGVTIAELNYAPLVHFYFIYRGGVQAKN